MSKDGNRTLETTKEYIESLKDLSDKELIDKDSEGDTLLHMAMKEEDARMAMALIKEMSKRSKTALFNVKDNDGNTALSYALALLDEHPKMAMALVNAMSPEQVLDTILRVDEEGRTPWYSMEESRQLESGSSKSCTNIRDIQIAILKKVRELPLDERGAVSMLLGAIRSDAPRRKILGSVNVDRKGLAPILQELEQVFTENGRQDSTSSSGRSTGSSASDKSNDAEKKDRGIVV